MVEWFADWTTANNRFFFRNASPVLQVFVWRRNLVRCKFKKIVEIDEIMNLNEEKAVILKDTNVGGNL
jgi:hypothetical protein